jgi:hypothetical protein
MNTTSPVSNPVGSFNMSSRRFLTAEECNARGLKTQSSWYDHSYCLFTVKGQMDLSRIQQAMHRKFYTPSCGKFGGGLSIGAVSREDDTHVLVEFIYHIGD